MRGGPHSGVKESGEGSAFNGALRGFVFAAVSVLRAQADDQ